MQLLFSFVFALSCTMFELIIFEILDVLHRRYGGIHPESQFLERPTTGTLIYVCVSTMSSTFCLRFGR